MKLSPFSIKKQEFRKGFRGYDPEEVENFLGRVADEVEELQKDNEELQKKLDDALEQVNEFRRIEKNLQDTLLKAQENSSKAIESTKKQSALLLKEAELKAQQIIDKAKEEAQEVRDSIISLREERDLIIAKLRAIVTTQSQLLDRKVAPAGDDEPNEKKAAEQPRQFQINIDQVVDKLL